MDGIVVVGKEGRGVGGRGTILQKKK